MREVDRILNDSHPLRRAVYMMQGVQEYVTMLRDDPAAGKEGPTMFQLDRADAACRRAENTLRELPETRK